MRNINLIAIAFIVLFSISVSGCDSKDYSLAPVSGTVTFEGKPVDKIRVSFNPKPIGENYAVGPYSEGKTGPDGKFSVDTRYDEEGAVIGQHTLSFMYSDIGETAMADLRSLLSDAQEGQDKAKFDEVKKKIAGLKAKLKGRPVLKKSYTKVIDVPADGVADLQIELSEL